MADFVRFLCDNGTTGVGYSGCGGFPFAITSGSSADFNPISVDYQTCVKWWWRVKKWKIDTDLAIVDSLGDSYALPSETLTAGGATQELDLIRATSSHIFNNTTAGDWSLSFGVMEFGNPQINYDGTDYYPGLLLDPAFNFVGGDPTDGQMQFSFYSFGAGSGESTFTATVDGLSITLYYVLVNTTSHTASKFDLEPVEYWPYATSTGATPVWDTSTGANLIDPTL